jgi:heme-degrading monooxygenase HmoA
MSASNAIAKTSQRPYCAVIFTSVSTEGERGSDRVTDRMLELAVQQPGFLGVESVRDAGGLGITVSYRTSEEAIVAWKLHTEHKAAQNTRQRVWNPDYLLWIACLERACGQSAVSA